MTASELVRFAEIDERGNIVVPGKQRKYDSLEIERHRAGHKFPCIDRGIFGSCEFFDHDHSSNRLIFAYYLSCCGQWYRPIKSWGIDYWVWVEVSQLRLKWWKFRKKI